MKIVLSHVIIGGAPKIGASAPAAGDPSRAQTRRGDDLDDDTIIG